MREEFLNIQKLFKEKKFSELIFFIESNFDKKNSQILNILAVTRLLRVKNKESYSTAIEEFKDAYLKDKESQFGLEALTNLINSKVDFYNFLGPYDKSKDFLSDFTELVSFFNEANNFFGYKPDLISSAIRVFNQLGELDKSLYYYDLLYKKNDLTLDVATSWIFMNNYKNNWDQEDYYNFSKIIDLKSTMYPKESLIPIVNKRGEKIKIGFLSSDIIDRHSITYFLKTILLNYDEKKYEIYLFLNNIREDETTNFFKSKVEETINIFKLNDLQAINLIREKKIDIIFDLMGTTSTNRVTLFKNRLAKTQVSWLGYCNTIGISQMDYLISDPNLIYPEEKNLYHEKILYMPNIWSCHSGFEFQREEILAPFLKNNYITFGSFNNFNKLNENVLNVWSNILKKIPNSKLLLKTSQRKERYKIEEIFKKNLANNNIEFLETKKSFRDHVDLYRKIDFAFDTFPYNGVTTSFEAIWMGVPVLTMRGYNFNSRCGESIMINAGMRELVANNEDDYINKAINIVNDKNQLLNLRKKLFNNIPASPLFDTERFSSDFYNLIDRLN
jgi:protein O-GlcNAc transferase